MFYVPRFIFPLIFSIAAICPFILLRVSDRFYSRTPWRKLRAAVLARRPLCEDPFKEHSVIGRSVPATVVDHVVPRSSRPDLELDERNLQALCARCHNRKTRGEQ